MTEQDIIAVPDSVRNGLVDLTMAIQQAQSRFNAYLLGAMSALDLDPDAWSVSQDGRRFVKKVTDNGDAV